jgi:hypothetical protein
MKRYVIDSADSMVDFFADLYLRTRSRFAPEDDLSLMVDPNGGAIFSRAETAYFDDILLDCFVYCADHHLDIDDIAARAHVTCSATTGMGHHCSLSIRSKECNPFISSINK